MENKILEQPSSLKGFNHYSHSRQARSQRLQTPSSPPETELIQTGFLCILNHVNPYLLCSRPSLAPAQTLDFSAFVSPVAGYRTSSNKNKKIKFLIEPFIELQEKTRLVKVL